MRLGKIKYLLSLLEENQLISAEQQDKIFAFMKERRRGQLFRLVQWLFVLGAFWVVFGFLAFIKLLNLSFLKNVYYTLKALSEPFIALMAKIFGPQYPFAICASAGLAVWALAFWAGNRIRVRESIEDFKLGYFQESKLRMATVFFVVAYIAAGIAFSLFNRLLLTDGISYYRSAEKIIPIFYMLAVPFFSYCAYRLKDQIALLFSIYFVALSLGTISGYGHACYYLAVSRPVMQTLVGVILLLVGYIHCLQGKEDWKEHFGRTYSWTGLLMVFLALWVMSIWGITKPEGYRWVVNSTELWLSNIAFIGASIGAMFYGARKEDSLFFNYGLTFMIIETFTIFFSHLWRSLGVAAGSLFLGCLIIGTGYLLRKTILNQRKVTE